MNITSQNDLNRQSNSELAITTSTKVEGSGLSAKSDDKTSNLNAFGKDGLTFSDFIDIVNPLHHIPLVGTFYRELSGDDIDPASKVLGGSLFLGPLGSVSALVNILVNEATGKDVAEHALSMFENTNMSQPKGAKIKPNETLDPVTAWAIAEASYHQTALNKIPTTSNSIYKQAKTDKGFVSNSPTVSVSDWAKSEVSFRKAISENSIQVRKNTKLVLTQSDLNKAQDEDITMPPFNNFFNSRKNAPNTTARENEKFSYRKTQKIVAMYERQKSISIKDNAEKQMQFKPLPPAGSIENEGDWFSDTMILALEKAESATKPIQ